MRWDPSQVLLGALALVAPHLLGGVHAASTLGLAAATCIALGSALWVSRGANRQEPVIEPMAGLLALMLGVTALHALPLSASLAYRIAPASLEHATATAQALGRPSPSSVPFSLDPASTHERIMYGIVVFSAFCSARLLEPRRRAALLATVAASTILISISDLLHRLFSASQVYGIYTPQVASHASPLLNPNNLAGFLALGFPLCLGFAVEQRGAGRWAWLLGAGVVAATNLLAGSRGGTVALLGAAGLFGALYVLRPAKPSSGPTAGRENHHRERQSAAKRALSAVPLTVLALMLAALLASLAAEDFVDTDYSDLNKLDLYRAEWQMLLEDPTSALLGVGRGAFGASFYRNNPWAGRALHAESLPLQYAIEFGLPMGALLVLGATLRLLRSLRDWTAPAPLGGLVGVSAISLQNLVDFSLELSGIALPAAVCLAAALPTATQPLLPPSACAALPRLGCSSASRSWGSAHIARLGTTAKSSRTNLQTWLGGKIARPSGRCSIKLPPRTRPNQPLRCSPRVNGCARIIGTRRCGSIDLWPSLPRGAARTY